MHLYVSQHSEVQRCNLRSTQAVGTRNLSNYLEDVVMYTGHFTPMISELFLCGVVTYLQL